MTFVSHILEFLACPTPDEWLQEANKPENLEILLIDHCNNELKASHSALSIIRRYSHMPSRVTPNNEKKAAATALLHKMSRLAREELRHFEQVLALMEKRGVQYRHLSPGTYAGKLRKGVRTCEPERLIDTLIVGAFIEARSCERFAMLAPHLDDELQTFYRSLLKSESRHFQDYLHLAEGFAGEYPAERVAFIAELERQAIENPDELFRFHSGVPYLSNSA